MTVSKIPTQINLDREGGQVSIAFDVYQTDGLPDYVGIYVVVKFDSAGSFIPIYIGRTDDQTIAERFESHHKMDCFEEQDWTHVACCEYTDAYDRELMERAFISYYRPPCND